MSLRIKKGGSEYHSRQGDGGTWLATRTPKNGEEEKIDDVGGWDEETKEAFEKVFKANQEGNKPPSKKKSKKVAPKEDGDDKKYVKAASAHFAESIQEFRKIEEIEKKFKKPITEAKARIKGIAAEKKKLFEAELTDKKKIKEKKERNKEAAVKTLSDESKMYQAILNEERKNYQAELIVHAQSNLGTEAMSDAVLKELNETEPTGEDIYGMFVEDGSTPANYPAAFKAFQKFVAKLKPKMAAVDAYALLNKFQMREEVSKEDYVQEAEKGTFDHTLNEFQIRKEVSTDDYVTEAAKGSFDHTSGGFTQEQVKDMLMAAPPKSSLTSSKRKNSG